MECPPSFGTIVLLYANNFDDSRNMLVPWRSVISRKDVGLFTLEDDSCHVLHFSDSIIENEQADFKTLKLMRKSTENFKLSDFYLQKISITVSPALSKYYNILYVLIKTSQDTYERVTPGIINKDNVYLYDLRNLNVKLKEPLEDSFIFGIQYNYSDTCGVVMTELQQNPRNTCLFQVHLTGISLTPGAPSLLLAPGTTIKVNYFKNKIYFVLPERGGPVGELSFSSMRRLNTADCCASSASTVFKYEVTGGSFPDACFCNNIIDNKFNSLSVVSGNLQLMSTCECGHNCGCLSGYKVISSRLELGASDPLRKFADVIYFTIH